MSSQNQLELWPTSSPGLEGGPTPSASPDGPTTSPCGPPPSPASRSAAPALGGGRATTATFGPSSVGSSPSASLQFSLESRLRARLEGLGSPLYALTWKHWAMPSGPPICALRGRGLRISASVCSGELSGWPTPDASGFTAKDIPRLMERRTKAAEKHGNNGFGLTLGQLTAATAAGWGTPTARDWKDGASVGTVEVNGALGRQVWTHGDPPDSCCAPTDERGRLHPSHAGWLMGYPPEWDSCGAMAMPLFRSSRRSS